MARCKRIQRSNPRLSKDSSLHSFRLYVLLALQSRESHACRTLPDKSELLNIPQAAYFLGVHRSFLDRRRVAGGGPRYIRLSARIIRYSKEDLLSWLDLSRRSNTSEIVENATS